METLNRSWRFITILLSFLLFHFLQTLAQDNQGNNNGYNYSATTECLADPWPPSYGGGIVKNAAFENDTEGWIPFGNAKLELRSSNGGNQFIAASKRKNAYDGPSQKLNLIQGNFYTISAWLQVSGENVSSSVVKATVKRKTSSGSTKYECAGTVIAKPGCWSLLKGGISPDDIDSSNSSALYFESQDTNVEILLDSVSVQPFTQEEWKQHQESSIQKNRRGKQALKIVDENGEPVAGANVSITQIKSSFPFGNAIAKNILDNEAYQKWYTERFNVAVFENELKWYSTEPQRNKTTYKDADAMVEFCKKNNISMRGHNIFWEDEHYIQGWIRSLNTEALKQAVHARIQSVVGRYAGDFVGWDVTNELLHFSFFEDRLGPNATLDFMKEAQLLDPQTPMFLNDYNVVEECNDMKAIPDHMVGRIMQIKSLEPGLKLGIGLESHYSKPNVVFLRSTLDKLGSLGVPLWLTEIDVGGKSDKQSEYLEAVLREAYSHPSVTGMVLWSAWHPNNRCYRMCLTDDNFANLPPGQVLDSLLEEWRFVSHDNVSDDTGVVNVYGGFGEYVAHVAESEQHVSFQLGEASEEDGHHVEVHIQ